LAVPAHRAFLHGVAYYAMTYIMIFIMMSIIDD